MRALLDVNAVIALLDADHAHHRSAVAWMEGHVGQGWATCSIVELGVIRVLGQPSYPAYFTLRAAGAALARITGTAHHRFWPDDVAPTHGDVDLGALLSPKQLTDAHLLALAVRHRGRLVTFDTRIRHDVVPGARPDHLVVIP